MHSCLKSLESGDYKEGQQTERLYALTVNHQMSGLQSENDSRLQKESNH